MRKKKQIKESKFCQGGKCNCDTKKTLANIFPYHLPNCLTEAEFDAINTKTTPEEELGEHIKQWRSAAVGQFT